MRDFEITHTVAHSYRQSNDSHGGLCFVMSKNYIIRETKDLVKGRILKVLCESKTKPDTLHNIVGFYRWPNIESFTDRRKRPISGDQRICKY